MPTAAKLVAAICFALVGVFFAQAAAPYFLDAKPPKYFMALCLVNGIWAGWVLCGRNAVSISSGIGTGLTAAVGTAFVALFAASFLRMLTKSLRRAYDGPFEALIDVGQMLADYAIAIGNIQTIGILICGGIVGGGIAGYFGRKYPR